MSDAKRSWRPIEVATQETIEKIQGMVFTNHREIERRINWLNTLNDHLDIWKLSQDGSPTNHLGVKKDEETLDEAYD